MPDLKILPSPRVNPYARENSEAVVSIMNILGSTEVARRRKIMTDNVLEAISRGGGQKEISAAALMEPGFSGGVPGFLQKLASPFADQAPGIEDIIAGQGIQNVFDDDVGRMPWAVSQMDQGQFKDYLDNYGRGVTVNTGQRLLSEPDRLARAKAEQDKAMGRTGPGFSPSDKKAAGEEMDTRLDKARKGFFGRPGRTNYTEDDLFREWKIYVDTSTFTNDNQRENAWNMWKNKVTNRNKEGWFGNEVDWDPNDPKWREAIGLKAPVESYPDPKTPDEFERTFKKIQNKKQQDLYFKVGKRLWPDQYK